MKGFVADLSRALKFTSGVVKEPTKICIGCLGDGPWVCILIVVNKSITYIKAVIWNIAKFPSERNTKVSLCCSSKTSNSHLLQDWSCSRTYSWHWTSKNASPNASATSESTLFLGSKTLFCCSQSMFSRIQAYQRHEILQPQPHG